MKKKYILPIVLGLLALGTLFALRTWPRTLDAEQCGELYRKYAATPGIHASFIKDYPVNDTLAVDVIQLQASSDSVWCALLSDFGMPKDLIDDYLANKEAFVSEKRNSLIKVTVNKNNIKQRLPIPDPDSRLTIGSYAKRSLCIFMTEDLNIKETICSTKVKHLTDETKN